MTFSQVRSLASVALRKAIEESEYEVHFDFFSVDFNEEFSALYGGSLSRLPDGDSQIFRLYVLGPSGFWTMAPLPYAAKFEPILSLD